MLLGFFETPIFYWEDLGCFESKEGLGRAWPEGLVEIFVHVTPKQERPRWGPSTERVKGRQTAEAGARGPSCSERLSPWVRGTPTTPRSYEHTPWLLETQKV